MSRIKAVFDTQIFLRALVNRNSISGRLAFEWEQDYTLVSCDQIDAEVFDVLTRSKLRRKFTKITDELVANVMSKLARAYRVTVDTEHIERICRDPKDDIFLACAKVAEANYLVSEDNDLLVLQQHHGTKIVNVVTFLNILEKLKNTPQDRP